jgi:hypothetical protein
MHPEFLRALANARREDLLSERRQTHKRAGPVESSPRFTRSRQRVGSVLIWTGARLIGNQRTALELARNSRTKSAPPLRPWPHTMGPGP